MTMMTAVSGRVCEMMFMSRNEWRAPVSSRFHSPSVKLEVIDVASCHLDFPDISNAVITEETSRRFIKPVTDVNNYITLLVPTRQSVSCLCGSNFVAIT